MNAARPVDPFTTLGVTPDADEAQIRARYLELVRQHPPERDPEKFQEIRKAFDAVKDPLSIARRLLEPPEAIAPEWSSMLETQKQNPPRLSLAFLLSLGNRASDAPTTPSLSD